MPTSLFFWIPIGILLFAFALAVQMRMMIGVVVARALRARYSALGVPESRLAVVLAGNGEVGDEPVQHIYETYPDQIKQLRLARKVCRIAPVLVLIGVIIERIAREVLGS